MIYKTRMTMKIFGVLATLMLALTIGLSIHAAPAHDDLPDNLFTDAGVAGDDGDPVVRRARYVTVDFPLLSDLPRADSEISKRVAMELFPDLPTVAIFDRVERNINDSVTWIGRLEDTGQSLVTLVVGDGVMMGKIVVGDETYEIHYAGEGLHKIVEIDQSAFPSELSPITPSLEPLVNDAAAEAALNAGDLYTYLPIVSSAPAQPTGATIDVMVLYTPQARAGDGGSTAAIQNRIALAVSESNTTYANSGITQRLNLVHMQEIGGFANDFSSDLSNMRVNSLVNSLRDSYHADHVVLIIENQASCGLAYFMNFVSGSFEAWAYGVVHRTCATGYYSFGHELGHNMGAGHDWYVDNGTSPYTHIHGYVDNSSSWRTVMSYYTECSANGSYCTRLPYWSNPEVVYSGSPMGVAAGTRANCSEGVSYPSGSDCDADNRLTLNNTAPTTSQFRSSQYTWTGHSSDWNAAENWVTYEGAAGLQTAVNRVPRSIDDVLIPALPEGGHWPLIAAGTVDVRDVTIEAGAQLNMSGGRLNIHGKWTEEETAVFNRTGGNLAIADR